ncbi:MAG TPA: sulfur carrier protein ThiS [Capillimicrobium sp.]|nr:sulfur carrier protein ThiS [Capillimicrobium sp.]
MIRVNGREREAAPGATVAQLVAELGVPAGGRGVAVALDGEVVPRGAWERTPVPDGAAVEIVTAVQGG